MNKKRDRIIIAIILAVCCVACISLALVIGKKSLHTNKSNTDSGIQFWSAPATEKIMQDRGMKEYADIAETDSISVGAVRNEYENAQLIMTAEKDINSYTVVVTDLKKKDGNAVISKDNVTVYTQKYVEVLNRINVYYNIPTGMYPDGLVPVENAAEYGETKIKKGENQGLWLTFYIPKEAETGAYSGSITVTYDGQEHITPIDLYVYDYTLADETHMRTAFSSEWPYENAELDTTYEMQKKYIDVLLDYRISTDLMRSVDANSQSGFDQLIEYANEPLKPVIYLPYDVETYADPTYGNVTSFDYDLMKEMILKFVNRSIADERNYIPQLIVYFSTMIDEPNPKDEGKIQQVQYISKSWNELLVEITKELKQDKEFMAKGRLAKEIVEEVQYIEHILAGYKTGDHGDAFADVEATWCPTHKDYYEGAEVYVDQHEKWWYTMQWPFAPYPTYHIDDVLISSRMLSWMQYEYGVVGNLYWAVNNYTSLDGTTMEDYYSLMCNKIAWGDGYLFYAGAKYGIDGPIPTIRLMSIRDGIEEYDMMCDLGEKYDELKETVDSVLPLNEVLQNYTQYLYDGAKSTATTKIFEPVRTTLLEMCEMSTTNAYLVGYEDVNGVNNYSILAADGIDVKKGKETLTKIDTYTIGDVTYGYYTAQVGDQKIKVVSGSREYVLNMKFVGSSKIITHEQMKAECFEFVNGGNVEDTIYQDKAVFKLSLPQMDSEKTQIVRFTHDDLFNMLDETSNTLTFEVYVEQTVTLKLNMKYENKKSMYEIAVVTLEPGLNKIDIKNLFSFDWEGQGKVEYAAFYFGEKGDSARNIYFGNIYLTTLNMEGGES